MLQPLGQVALLVLLQHTVVATLLGSHTYRRVTDRGHGLSLQSRPIHEGLWRWGSIFRDVVDGLLAWALGALRLTLVGGVVLFMRIGLRVGRGRDGSRQDLAMEG